MFPTVEDCYEWLGTLGVSLWADWYIESPERRRLAAEWLHKQMTEVMSFTDAALDAKATLVPDTTWDGSTASWDVV